MNGFRLRYLGINYPLPFWKYPTIAGKPRVQFPGALYHVIVRGNKGQKVFRREEDGFMEKLMELEKNLVEGRKTKIKK